VYERYEKRFYACKRSSLFEKRILKKRKKRRGW
jgi:hypothetical protein